jgi:chaperonin GroES
VLTIAAGVGGRSEQSTGDLLIVSAYFQFARVVNILEPQGDPMKLRPLHDRVIVKRLEQETKTASGIVIPDNAAEKPDQGEVLAVGPGKRNDKGDFVALNIKVGDRVLFGKYSGQTVKVDGDELLVMREEDLFAVVEK